jgi:hypothetical protein
VPLHPEEEDGSGESEQEDADNNATYLLIPCKA